MSTTDTTMKGLLITDPVLIQKYKDELKLKGVYIPPQRDIKTMDEEALKTGTHVKSMDMVGQQSAIAITVNETDPERESQDSIFRMHLRVADGVHRWVETKNKGRSPEDELEIKFYSVKDYQEYAKLKAILDTHKADNPAEKKFDIESLCESIFRKGTSRDKVSAAVKLLYEGVIPESTLNEFIPSKFKEQSKVRKKDKKPEEAEESKEPSKHQEQLTKMVAEITALTKENSKLVKDRDALKEEVKQLNDILTITGLEKTVNVDGLENVQVTVIFDSKSQNFVVRKA